MMETEKHERLQQISFEHELRKKQLEELKILEQKKADERLWKLAEEQMVCYDLFPPIMCY